jgi:hypothetical protein
MSMRRRRKLITLIISKRLENPFLVKATARMHRLRMRLSWNLVTVSWHQRLLTSPWWILLLNLRKTYVRLKRRRVVQRVDARSRLTTDHVVAEDVPGQHHHKCQGL